MAYLEFVRTFLALSMRHNSSCKEKTVADPDNSTGQERMAATSFRMVFAQNLLFASLLGHVVSPVLWIGGGRGLAVLVPKPSIACFETICCLSVSQDR